LLQGTDGDMLKITRGLVTRLIALGAAHYCIALNAFAQHVPHGRSVPNIPGGGSTSSAANAFGALVVTVAIGWFFLMLTMIFTEDKSRILGQIGIVASIGMAVASWVWFRPAIDMIVIKGDFFATLRWS
jgi:hypothetical protein